MSIVHVAWLVLGGWASPPEAPAIVPEAFCCAPGARVPARVEPLADPAGAGGAEVAWFFVRSGGTQTNADAPEFDALGRVILPLDVPGRSVVGIDWRPRVEAMPSARLRAVFEERGDDAPRNVLDDAPEAMARVRRIESAKLIVTTGDGPFGGATATSKTGQQVEVRPLVDPAGIEIGSDLPFKVYAPGEGRLVVRAIHGEDPPRAILTSADRVAHFRIDAPGVWRLEARTIVILDGDPSADVELASATLVFEVAVPAAGGKEGGR